MKVDESDWTQTVLWFRSAPSFQIVWHVLGVFMLLFLTVCLLEGFIQMLGGITL